MKFLPIEYATRNLGRSPMRLILNSIGNTIVILLIMIAFGFIVGMNSTLNVSGSNKNIMLLGAGSLESVERSEVKKEAARIIASSISGYKVRAQVEGISPEVHIQIPININTKDELILIRGIQSEAFLVHDKVNITFGLLPRVGENELLVGRLAARTLGYQIPEEAIGENITLDNDNYTISGIMNAGGGVIESEIWAPLSDLLITTQRDTLSCIVVALENNTQSAIEGFCASRVDLELSSISEKDYYSALGDFYKPIKIMVVATCLMIAIGGLLGGFNSMYATFASRVREVGTLQTLGYQRGAILLSLVQESILTSSISSIFACLISLTILDEYTIRFSMGTFKLLITTEIIAIGIATGLILGIIGAVIPSIRCLRLSIPESLRSFV